ncbi:MAG: hypothetical protein AB8B47_11780 [Roseobacter sp.]
MTAKFLIPFSALLLGACATITAESRSTIIVDNEEYELRTRTIETNGRSYETTDAVVKGFTQTCIPSSPGDCEAAVRRALNQFAEER